MMQQSKQNAKVNHERNKIYLSDLQREGGSAEG